MDWSALAFLIGNLVGMVVKHKTDWNNKLIPILVFVVQLVVRFGAGLASVPDASPVAAASFFGDLGLLGQLLLGSVGQAVLDTANAVLLHSASRGAKELLKLRLRMPYTPGPPTARY